MLTECVRDLASGAEGVEAGWPLVAAWYSQGQPFVGLVNAEAVQCRLVEVVQNLADDAGLFDFDSFKGALGDGGVDQRRHLILAGFQGQKRGFARAVGETGAVGEQRPVELDGLLSQAGKRGDAHGSAGGHPDAVGVQRCMVGGCQRALRQQHQDVVPAHAFLLQQLAQVGDSCRGFAGAEGAGEEVFGPAVLCGGSVHGARQLLCSKIRVFTC